MPLNLPAGSSCFVDANIFYYAFVQTPALSEPCSDLLEQAADGRIRSYTSAHALAEAGHKVMMTEVCQRFGIPRAGAVRWAQQNPLRLRELEQCRKFISDLARMQIPMLSVDMKVLMAAVDVSSQYGLLTNDAIMVALMRQHALSDLATNDDDFDHVDDLTIWKPR